MRIQGITIPENKRLERGLTAVFGIGHSRAKQILDTVGVDRNKKSKDLTEKEENEVRKQIEKFVIEGDLKREVSGNIKRLKDIGAYRGKRHALGLPVRGQLTKTNSRTRRGNVRKTMASGRKAVDKK